MLVVQSRRRNADRKQRSLRRRKELENRERIRKRAIGVGSGIDSYCVKMPSGKDTNEENEKARSDIEEDEMNEMEKRSERKKNQYDTGLSNIIIRLLFT